MLFIIALVLLFLAFFILQDKGVQSFFTKFGKHIFAILGGIALLLILGPARILNFIFSAIIGLIPFFGTNTQKFSKHSESHSKSASTTKSENEIQEALEILELTGNPTKDDVEEAYRKLIKKHHPDKGGSKYFTRKIIKARKLLIDKISAKGSG